MQLTRARSQPGAATDIEGREVIVGERHGQEILLGEKVPPAAIPEVWPARVERYEVVNPDREFPIVEPTVWLERARYELPDAAPLGQALSRADPADLGH